jgi:hypothetical protein
VVALLPILPIRGTNVDVVGIWSDIMSKRIDMDNRVVIPSEIFSFLSPLADEGVKKPTMEMRVMMQLGIIRLMM